MHEVDEKVERLARLARRAGLGGILLNTQPNFSWLTAGRSNRIDGSRENGSGSLLITAGGKRYAVANNIEMPRLQDEALAGLGFSACEYAWTEEQRDPGQPIAAAKRLVGTEAVGCDAVVPGATPMEASIAHMRAPLTDAELARYRALGRDLGRVVGDVCRELTPGLTEIDVARRAAAAIGCVGARANVTLVAADDRLGRYRHPVPTDAEWQRIIMVVVCAQRDGLVAALSRIVSAGPVPPDLLNRTAATGRVFERLLGATVPGATGAELFGVAAAAYADVGFTGEEANHHQGGAIGYRSREWIAHPASAETVQVRQAFAWNPSITGTKIEDTALLSEAGLELVTSSPNWPVIPIALDGHQLSAAGILRL